MTFKQPQYRSSYPEEDIGYRLIDTAIAFLVTLTAFVLLRIKARMLRNRSWMWQDVFVSLAYISSIAGCIVSILAVKKGSVGRHLEAVLRLQPSSMKYYFEFVYIAGPIIYMLAVTFPKLAILDIYLHIFQDIVSRRTCWITVAVIVLAACINITLITCECSPMDYLWESKIDPEAVGHCHNIPKQYLWASFPNIITDVVMFLLPLPAVFKLQGSLKTRLGVLITFLTGSVGIAVSITRFVIFTQSYADSTWVTMSLIIWTIAEPGAYLIAACVLTFRPLLVYIFYDSPLSSVMRRLSSSKTPCSHPPVVAFNNDISLAKRKRNEYDIELQENAFDEDTVVSQERTTDSILEGVISPLPSHNDQIATR